MGLACNVILAASLSFSSFNHLGFLRLRWPRSTIRLRTSCTVNHNVSAIINSDNPQNECIIGACVNKLLFVTCSIMSLWSSRQIPELCKKGLPLSSAVVCTIALLWPWFLQIAHSRMKYATAPKRPNQKGQHRPEGRIDFEGKEFRHLDQGGTLDPPLHQCAGCQRRPFQSLLQLPVLPGSRGREGRLGGALAPCQGVCPRPRPVSGPDSLPPPASHQEGCPPASARVSSEPQHQFMPHHSLSCQNVMQKQQILLNTLKFLLRLEGYATNHSSDFENSRIYPFCPFGYRDI